jgi:RNA polymerase sigma-70 factor (ECF subfamily)
MRPGTECVHVEVTGPAGAPADEDMAAWTLDDLLIAVGGRREGTFAALYARLRPPVRGVIGRILIDPGVRDEVTQEVMLELWLKAAEFDPARGTAATWALMIAHRRAVDRRRGDGALARTYRPAGTAALWDPVAEAVEDAQERQRLRTMLDELTGLQREAVLLAFYGEYTYRQVAVILGVPEGTLKSRIRDGLIRLRDAMGDADND